MMTEQEKAQLVEHCQSNIAQARGVLTRLKGVDENLDTVRKIRTELRLQEIALASLTAEPARLKAQKAVAFIAISKGGFDKGNKIIDYYLEDIEQLEEGSKLYAEPRPAVQPLKMFGIIYKPTGVPIGLYIDAENAIKRCKFLSESQDFIVSEVEVTEVRQVKFKRDNQE